MRSNPQLALLVVALALAACRHSVPANTLPLSSPSPFGGPRLTDAQLLDDVQRRTFRYFWDFAHPGSGMARDRSNVTRRHGAEVVATGGTGFGVMAILVAAERGFITRAEALERLQRITTFLAGAERHHGVFPHWMDGSTGRTIPFGEGDDGGDVVETAYLFEGLLAARQYFDRSDRGEEALRTRIDSLWRDVDWTWHVRPGTPGLMWNWSPTRGFLVDLPVRGWNEALITYVLAASSPTHPIDPAHYHRGWAREGALRNGHEYYGIRLPLGPPYGGPLFFEHYSFLGLDPRGLVDRYADYWEQVVNHTLVNREHCVRNPNAFKGYGADSWGLTASDVRGGYVGNASPTVDRGTIAPTAALSSFPYTPEHSMRALRHFHDDMGGALLGEWGFRDAFNETEGWVTASALAIDQGPIIVMIENHRTGLLWRLFMSSPEVRDGLRRLGFASPHLRE